MGRCCGRPLLRATPSRSRGCARLERQWIPAIRLRLGVRGASQGACTGAAGTFGLHRTASGRRPSSSPATRCTRVLTSATAGCDAGSSTCSGARALRPKSSPSLPDVDRTEIHADVAEAQCTSPSAFLADIGHDRLRPRRAGRRLSRLPRRDASDGNDGSRAVRSTLRPTEQTWSYASRASTAERRKPTLCSGGEATADARVSLWVPGRSSDEDGAVEPRTWCCLTVGSCCGHGHARTHSSWPTRAPTQQSASTTETMIGMVGQTRSRQPPRLRR